jgi:hypothetical protein
VKKPPDGEEAAGWRNSHGRSTLWLTKPSGGFLTVQRLLFAAKEK